VLLLEVSWGEVAVDRPADGWSFQPKRRWYFDTSCELPLELLPLQTCELQLRCEEPNFLLGLLAIKGDVGACRWKRRKWRAHSHLRHNITSRIDRQRPGSTRFLSHGDVIVDLFANHRWSRQARLVHET
jgi:hypothetical protein